MGKVQLKSTYNLLSIWLIKVALSRMYRFSPDVIGEAGSYCLVLQLIEIGVMTACLYLLNSSISILDLLSFSGYKYACLVINAVIYQLTGKFGYYVSILYTGLAVSYFTV
jgi:hypothetical protein